MINKIHIIFGHKIDHTILWERYVVLRRHTQSVYDAALLKYNNSIRESLSTAMHPRNWWSTLSTFLLGVNSTLTSIRTGDSSVTYDLFKTAEVFFSFFRINRVIRNSVFLQLVFPILNSVIF